MKHSRRGARRRLNFEARGGMIGLDAELSDSKDLHHVESFRAQPDCFISENKLPILSKREYLQIEPRPSSYSKDRFFWTGDHQEDRLNELRARNGFSDKLSVANENGSVRAVIHGELGRKGALLLLSSYLRMACTKRKHAFMLNTAHMFKPPPRVTLVDSRRDNWLDDLANLRVPLRKLSRTIPHGVRGASLIEHCASRHITYYRSVWLCRCVNSNELRGLKRKAGTSSAPLYIKWMEEWTVHVLEAVFRGVLSGSIRGRKHIRYMLGLFSQMANEQLLDCNKGLGPGNQERVVSKLHWYLVAVVSALVSGSCGNTVLFKQLLIYLVREINLRTIRQRDLQLMPAIIKQSLLQCSHEAALAEKEESFFLRFFSSHVFSLVSKTDIVQSLPRDVSDGRVLKKYALASRRLVLCVSEHALQDINSFRLRVGVAITLLGKLRSGGHDIQASLHHLINRMMERRPAFNVLYVDFLGQLRCFYTQLLHKSPTKTGTSKFGASEDSDSLWDDCLSDMRARLGRKRSCNVSTEPTEYQSIASKSSSRALHVSGGQ
ncbi:hypothetical protein BJ508DRAFT_107318 [Ascobolus immersus RN42]|uniref:Mediator of RNA polymerase II transcription subunit 12 n=1 Tax=Ascobolus immersus RN42 TaxID=1160509 RepID=A0A3N4IAZ2_ASCIM|nr:hypothetical protein BJ508DRAFT_107318 [Ascobolus immersus RN42]